MGTAVKAMIVNALGFSNKALYLTPQFYENRPVELLIAEGVQASDLHDDCLGTALDALYENGITEVFYSVSSRALSAAGIKHRFVHLDSTTFSLHGEYDVSGERKHEDDPEVVSITKGFSKDQHPELNQVILSLMCAHRSTIPVWLEVLSGNESDKKSFHKSIAEYKKQFRAKRLPYFVADSALYTKEGLSQMSDIRWVTRVPETIRQARERILETDSSHLTPSDQEGYSYREVQETYAGVTQRWLIVFSKKAYEREYETLAKNIRKECEEKGQDVTTVPRRRNLRLNSLAESRARPPPDRRSSPRRTPHHRRPVQAARPAGPAR